MGTFERLPEAEVAGLRRHSTKHLRRGQPWGGTRPTAGRKTEKAAPPCPLGCAFPRPHRVGALLLCDGCQRAHEAPAGEAEAIMATIEAQVSGLVLRSSSALSASTSDLSKRRRGCKPDTRSS
jgi:hypothetical protein